MLFAAFNVSLAGFERTPQPPAVYASGMSSLFAGDIEDVLLNPSAAVSIQSLHASVFYSPSPFGLPQLSNGGLMIAMPTDLFETGFMLTRTGYSLYQELTATAVFARTFGGVISAGCNVNCDHLSIQGYGSALTVGMDLAATVQCSDDIRWGISILNINRPTIGQAKEPLPQWYLTGITCRVLSNASVSFLVCKDAMYPLSIRTGVKFSPLEALNLQIGTSNEPSRYYAGIGISYMSVEAEYSVVTHADLGLTHVIGLSFSP